MVTSAIRKQLIFKVNSKLRKYNCVLTQITLIKNFE